MSWNLEGGRSAEILLVEDNEDDVVLTRLALERLGLPAHLHEVGDGEAGLRFLRREPPFSDAPPVDLVLLDINLPRLDGFDTLASIAADPALRHIPVVVLTTSSRDADVARMYALRCSGYVVKPVDLERFFGAIRQVCLYWFSTVCLPKRTAGG